MNRLTLYVQGEPVDMYDDTSIRINYTAFEPERITASTDTEYSFSFNLPKTDKNNRIFNYANNPSKVNKFVTAFDAELVSDSNTIFNGRLELTEIDSVNYKSNLLIKKGADIENIFGDDTFKDLRWFIPFEGISTINSMNADSSNNAVIFPLISYGVFQKKPYYSDSVGKEYTSKFLIDGYTKFWVESFYPSMSMLQTLKKCFEHAGYRVNGNAFTNQHLSNIYMSTSIAREQMPVYNLGNPRFGEVSLNCSFSSSGKTALTQELEFPYFRFTADSYNWSEIDVFDMLYDGNVTVNAPTYMYEPEEHLIVIPADGFYKIQMTVNASLDTTGSMSVAQKYMTGRTDENEDKMVTVPATFNEFAPLEIQLVRNYDENIELIKGKNNKSYLNGNPNSTPSTWVTCFPHEDPYAASLPTEKNDLTVKNPNQYGGGARRRTNSTMTNNGASTRAESSRTSTSSRRFSNYNFGYSYADNTTMAYDPAVSDAFICGFSTFMNGTTAVLKNGKSWSGSYADKMESFYIQNGYQLRTQSNGSTIVEQTQYNQNVYPNAPSSYITLGNNNMNGSVSCMVYLKRNDVLQLMAVQRHYDTLTSTLEPYKTSANVSLKITAASPRNYFALKADNFGYNSDSEFDYDLRLSNFLNEETRLADFVANCVKAFNLELIQTGNIMTINTKRKIFAKSIGFVDIDDRCNFREAEMTRIDYPKSMAVEYKIDTEEWGFETTVPQERLNEDDWEKYGDYGYTVLNIHNGELNDREEKNQLNFSYTWYDDFEFESGGTISIPVISEFSWMIDGYDYEESAKHDGYSLTQRFWYRNFTPSGHNVKISTYPIEYADVYTTTNLYNGVNLSYKSTEHSLLNEFFNVKANVRSNYAEAETWLTAEEYNMLKNGANVRYDKDVYRCVSITGYDPSHRNKSKLKLLKV
jgi:hypothetical protein